MDRRHVVIVGALLLGGCAAGPQVSEPDWDGLMWHIGHAFAHKPVLGMASRYGVPHEQSTFEGFKVYRWHTTREFRRMVPTTTTTAGAVRDPSRPWSEPIPFSYTTSGERERVATWNCTLTAWVDAQGTVANLQVSGNWGACETMYP